MPAKGGHLDLGDEEIRKIAREVIELAQNYAEKNTIQGTASRDGYFKERFGPVVSTGLRLYQSFHGHPQKVRPNEEETLPKREKIIGGFKKWQAKSMKECDWKIYPN